MSVSIAALSALAVFVGAFLQRVAGFGLGLILAPSLSFLLGPFDGVFMSNLCSIIVSGSLMGVRHKDIDWPRIALMSLVSIPGTRLGVWLVSLVPTAWLQIVIGVAVLSAVLLSRRRAISATGGWLTVAAFGFIGGVLVAAVGISGPLMLVLASIIGWTQPQFVASVQPYFIVTNLSALTVKLSTGVAGVGMGISPWYLLPIVAGVTLALLVGHYAQERIGAERARQVAVVLAVASALVVIARGIAGLGH